MKEPIKQSKVKPVVVSCDYCKKTADRFNMVTIMQRKLDVPSYSDIQKSIGKKKVDFKKVYTGKKFKLCPDCRSKYFKGEIKSADINSDQKKFLESWNKSPLLY